MMQGGGTFADPDNSRHLRTADSFASSFAGSYNEDASHHGDGSQLAPSQKGLQRTTDDADTSHQVSMSFKPVGRQRMCFKAVCRKLLLQSLSLRHCAALHVAVSPGAPSRVPVIRPCD